MEKKSDFNKTKDSNNIFENQLSSFAYDSFKKTLYYSDNVQTDLSALEKQDTRIDSVEEFPTRFTHNLPSSDKAIAENENRDSSDSVERTEVDEEKRNTSYRIPETLRFCKRTSTDEISPSGLTATCKNNSTDKFSYYYSNLTFKRGVHYWEVICPISCSGIEFGIKDKETNEITCVTFRTTTPRIVGMRLDMEALNLNFWLNGRSQPKRNQNINKGEYYILIKMKNYNNSVIMNPFAQHTDENLSLPQNLLLSEQERELILSTCKAKASAKKVGEDAKTQEPIKKKSENEGDEVPEEGKAQHIKSFEDKQGQVKATSETIESAVSNQKEFAQNYELLVNTYESLRMKDGSDASTSTETSKWKTIDYTDKVLQVTQDGLLKVFTRDEHGKHAIYNNWTDKLKANHVAFHLTKDDAIFLIKNTNWDGVINA